jgi:hypothetical protein
MASRVLDRALRKTGETSFCGSGPARCSRASSLAAEAFESFQGNGGPLKVAAVTYGVTLPGPRRWSRTWSAHAAHEDSKTGAMASARYRSRYEHLPCPVRAWPSLPTSARSDVFCGRKSRGTRQDSPRLVTFALTHVHCGLVREAKRTRVWALPGGHVRRGSSNQCRHSDT